jgi:hypothetical protein
VTYQIPCDLKQRHPDIEVDSDCDKPILIAKSVNRIANCCPITEEELEWVDDTCADPNLIGVYAWPCMLVNGEDNIVFANPCQYFIGYHNDKGFGIVPNISIFDDMERNTINPKIIKMIKEFLESKPPINYLD